MKFELLEATPPIIIIIIIVFIERFTVQLTLKLLVQYAYPYMFKDTVK